MHTRAAPAVQTLNLAPPASVGLRAVLPPRSDTQVLVELLEDDLQQGFAHLARLETYLRRVRDLVQGDQVTPSRLVEASQDLDGVEELCALDEAVGGLRRRLARAAPLIGSARSASVKGP
ncbi:MAG TPA: hypothetical protein VEY30_11010 [Myxococcaceae bacterium]|nr:hypothetical protein [Myxococcaceae bacterium]